MVDVKAGYRVIKPRPGDYTNNELEYLAILYALGHIRNKKYKHVVIYSDSKLAVNQIKSKWKTMDPKLIALRAKVSHQLNIMSKNDVKFQWIRRDANLAGIWLEEYQYSFAW